MFLHILVTILSFSLLLMLYFPEKALWLPMVLPLWKYGILQVFLLCSMMFLMNTGDSSVLSLISVFLIFILYIILFSNVLFKDMQGPKQFVNNEDRAVVVPR